MSSAISLGYLILTDLDIEMFLALGLTNGSDIAFRWGYDKNIMSHWHHYALLNADIDVQANQSTVVLTLCDYSIHLRTNSCFASYIQNRQSEIVTQIASSYSLLPASVVKTSAVPQDYYQHGETDWDFLVRNCADAISEGEQQGDYRLWWKCGNELHFHPPDYTQKPYRHARVSGGTDSQKFTLRMSPFKRSLLGGGLFQQRGFLRDSVSPYTKNSTPEELLGKIMISKRELPDSSISSTRPNSFHGIYKYDEGSTKAIIDSGSVGEFYKAYSSTYEIEIFFQNDPQLEPGSLIYVSTSRNIKPYVAEGLWLVESVFHTVLPGEVGMTTSRLSRPFLSKGSLSNSNVNSQRSDAVGRLSSVEGKDVSNVENAGTLIQPVPDYK